MAEHQKKDLYEAPLSSAGMEDSKAYRRFVAATSADKTDNRAAWSNEMNDAFAALKVQESTGVKDREEPLPKFAVAIRKLGSILMMGGMAWFLIYLLLCGIGIWGTQKDPPVFLLYIPLVLIGVGLVLWGTIRIISGVRNRRAWIERMRVQDAEKAEKAEKAQQLKDKAE